MHNTQKIAEILFHYARNKEHNQLLDGLENATQCEVALKDIHGRLENHAIWMRGTRQYFKATEEHRNEPWFRNAEDNSKAIISRLLAYAKKSPSLKGNASFRALIAKLPIPTDPDCWSRISMPGYRTRAPDMLNILKGETIWEALSEYRKQESEVQAEIEKFESIRARVEKDEMQMKEGIRAKLTSAERKFLVKMLFDSAWL